MFGESSRSYIAIINNKTINITLQKNLFNRKGTSIESLPYNVSYNDGIEIMENDLNYEDIMEIAMDIKERVPSIREAKIYYLQEGKYAFVYLHDENDLTVRIYFYYENNYIESINNKEYLSEIIYYK